MKSSSEDAKSEFPLWKKPVLTIGGILAITGGLGYFLTLLLHGDLPDNTPEAALEHIAGRPEWRIMKLCLIVFALCWVGAFEAYRQSLRNTISRLPARLAVVSGTIGVSIVVVEYSFIGYALKEIADRWAIAPETDPFIDMARLIIALSAGLFHSFIAWMIGLPFILTGISLTKNPDYHSWFGWIAIVLGTGALIAGITRFLGYDLVPYPLLYGGFIIPLNIWLAVFGGFMLHLSKRKGS